MKTLIYLILASPMALAQDKELKLTPTFPEPGQVIERAAKERLSNGVLSTGTLCKVGKHAYEAKLDDADKCEAIGGTLVPGIDPRASNVRDAHPVNPREFQRQLPPNYQEGHANPTMPTYYDPIDNQGH